MSVNLSQSQFWTMARRLRLTISYASPLHFSEGPGATERAVLLVVSQLLAEAQRRHEARNTHSAQATAASLMSGDRANCPMFAKPKKRPQKSLLTAVRVYLAGTSSTEAQRKHFYLAPVPPRWCITGPVLEPEKDPAKWPRKWPHHSPQ